MIQLLRHGQSTWNLLGLLQGQRTGIDLTPLGRAQAAAAAVALAGRGIERVVTSDLRRAADTAALIAAELAVPLRHSPLLRERGYGQWEGLPMARVRACASAADWADRDFRPPGGESVRDVVRRMLSALVDAGAGAVVVSHGEAIACALAALGRPAEPILGNGEFTAVDPAEVAGALDRG